MRSAPQSASPVRLSFEKLLIPPPGFHAPRPIRSTRFAQAAAVYHSSTMHSTLAARISEMRPSSPPAQVSTEQSPTFQASPAAPLSLRLPPLVMPEPLRWPAMAASSSRPVSPLPSDVPMEFLEPLQASAFPAVQQLLSALQQRQRMSGATSRMTNWRASSLEIADISRGEARERGVFAARTRATVVTLMRAQARAVQID